MTAKAIIALAQAHRREPSRENYSRLSDAVNGVVNLCKSLEAEMADQGPYINKLRDEVARLTAERDAAATENMSLLRRWAEWKDSLDSVMQQRDAYQRAADDMAAVHKVERDELASAGSAQAAIIRQAQMLLTRYLTEELSQPTVVNDLLGLLDGPEQRTAQTLWDNAMKAKND